MPLILSQEDSKLLAQNIVEALVHKLGDEKTVNELASLWGKQLDGWIGRTVRHFAFYVLGIALLTLAVKFQVWRVILT